MIASASPSGSSDFGTITVAPSLVAFVDVGIDVVDLDEQLHQVVSFGRRRPHAAVDAARALRVDLAIAERVVGLAPSIRTATRRSASARRDPSPRSATARRGFPRSPPAGPKGPALQSSRPPYTRSQRARAVIVTIRFRSSRCSVTLTSSIGIPTMLATQRESAWKFGRSSADSTAASFSSAQSSAIVRRRQPQPPAERAHVAAGQPPLAAEDLRERRVIDREIAREGAERVARVGRRRRSSSAAARCETSRRHRSGAATRFKSGRGKRGKPRRSTHGYDVERRTRSRAVAGFSTRHGATDKKTGPGVSRR